MRQIDDYIEAMFAVLPKDKDVEETKQRILEHMYEKFEAINSWLSGPTAMSLLTSKAHNLLTLMHSDSMSRLCSHGHNTLVHKPLQS